MSKKITVNLSKESVEYLNELMYSLDKGDGKVATISECINWALESMALFEENSGEDLVSYLQSNYDVYSKKSNNEQ